MIFLHAFLFSHNYLRPFTTYCDPRTWFRYLEHIQPLTILVEHSTVAKLRSETMRDGQDGTIEMAGGWRVRERMRMG